MAFTILGNQRVWSGGMDDDGHRSYKVKFLLKTNLPGLDGPAQALQTFGLPRYGDVWAFGNDLDIWAYCKKQREVSPLQSGDDIGRQEYFQIELLFSTKPDGKRCKEQQIEDPLLTPMEISGGFKNYNEEIAFDRFGVQLLTSSYEPIRGNQVEFDANRPTVKIQQNVPMLQLEIFGAMVDTLNDSPLWGLPPRCIKLSSAPWEKKYYGLCNYYFTRSFEFDINAKLDLTTGAIVSGFDRDVLDEGSKALRGHWDVPTGKYILDKIAGQFPDPNNPQHFKVFTDREGNPSKVILNGAGLPSGVIITGKKVLVTNHTIAGNGNHTQTIINQPTDPDFIHIFIDDPVFNLGTGSSDPGYIFLSGIINSNQQKSEYIKLESGSHEYISTLKYKTLSQAVLSDIILAGPFDVEFFTKDINRQSMGYRHIEKYTESNFLLLGIPVSLET